MGRQRRLFVAFAALAHIALCWPGPCGAAQPAVGHPRPSAQADAGDPAKGAPSSATGKKFDMEAARMAVRAMHFSDDAASSQASGVVLSGNRAEVARFREKAELAKRPECLTAFQGMGVLALVAMPLAMLIDKKDSGCKFNAVR